jgi:hypothetical protein
MEIGTMEDIEAFSPPTSPATRRIKAKLEIAAPLDLIDLAPIKVHSPMRRAQRFSVFLSGFLLFSVFFLACLTGVWAISYLYDSNRPIQLQAPEQPVSFMNTGNWNNVIAVLGLEDESSGTTVLAETKPLATAAIAEKRLRISKKDDLLYSDLLDSTSDTAVDNGTDDDDGGESLPVGWSQS